MRLPRELQIELMPLLLERQIQLRLTLLLERQKILVMLLLLFERRIELLLMFMLFLPSELQIEPRFVFRRLRVFPIELMRLRELRIKLMLV